MAKRKYRSKNFSWDKLDALLQFKVALPFCADYLECSEDTIERRIRDEWDMTFSEYHALRMQRTSVKLQQKMIEMALSGNTTAMIFSLKNLAGWSDKLETNITAKDDEKRPPEELVEKLDKICTAVKMKLGSGHASTNTDKKSGAK